MERMGTHKPLNFSVQQPRLRISSRLSLEKHRATNGLDEHILRLKVP